MTKNSYPSSEKLDVLKLKFAPQASKHTLTAQRVLNIIEKARILVDVILSDTVEQDRAKKQQQLNTTLNELSSLFHESTHTEQKRFIELLMERDSDRWKLPVSFDYDDWNRPINVDLSTWDKFDKLPHSQPETRDNDKNIKKDMVIHRERGILAIYGVFFEDISQALRKR